jgi:hypothetical protein
MSSAFVKESEEQWLHEIPPTLAALIVYLTRENNGVRVYEKSRQQKGNVTIYSMSNGLSYAIDSDSKWGIV